MSSINRKPSNRDGWEWEPRDGAQQSSHQDTASDAMELTWNSTLLLLPMLVFSAILLGLVYTFRVEHNPENLQSFGDTIDPVDDGAIYVNLDAPRLVFIASWSSTLAPMLIGSALFLISYPVAKSMLAATHSGKIGLLPTPYQLSLILRILVAGGPMAIWDWLSYAIGWKKHRQAQSHTLKTAGTVLVVATLLSALVFLADTWLHVATRSTLFTQIFPVTNAPDYSYRLSPWCYADVSEGGCSLIIAGDHTSLYNETTSYTVLGNLSSSTMVGTIQGEDAADAYAFLDVPGSAKLASIDYRASTYAAKTQCALITHDCNAEPISETLSFWCNRAFKGYLYMENGTIGWYMDFFADANMQTQWTYGEISNPFYFGWGWLTDAQESAEGSDYTWGERQGSQVLSGALGFVMSCNTTVYDVQYDFSNGTISRFVTQMSNATVASLLQIPMAQIPDLAYLQERTNEAMFSNDAEEMVHKMTLSYSNAALSMAAQSFVQYPADYAQQRSSLLVARVPKAPLFTLVVANVLLALAGAVLLAIALSVRTAEVREVQARLSVVGLTAFAFESRHSGRPAKHLEELFEEKEGQTSARVRVQKSSAGGYDFRSFRDDAGVELTSLT